MQDLDTIAEAIRETLEAKHRAREEALERSRALIRHCANAIRSIHREEWEHARDQLTRASERATEMTEGVDSFLDLYHSGYVQDALKEYVEAELTYAMVRGQPLPTVEGLRVEPATYLNGLAEAASELRRRVLDILRHHHDAEAERLMAVMDEVYGVLITFDFPDAVTGGLRHRVDSLRGVLERTRGDLTSSFSHQRLIEALEHFETLVTKEDDG